MNERRCEKNSQLVLWYRCFLEHGRSAAFVSLVSTRYANATLARMTQSRDHEIRRASVLALGMIGNHNSIPFVGECLSDPDRCVRIVAEVALSDLLRREFGTPAARQLDAIRRHVDGGRYEKSIALLKELTQAWPRFSEAWYQLGMATFAVSEFQAALQYAQHALGICKFHFAAHALEARCWLELEQPANALRSFERSYFVNPSQIAVKQYIDEMKRTARHSNPDER